MGLIADLEFPHVVIPARRQVAHVTLRSRRELLRSRPSRLAGISRSSRIMRDTPLVPRAAAEQVLEEASRLLHATLPSAWVVILARRAEAAYENSERFRSRVQLPCDEGREWLWAFMRHWVSALLQQNRPQLFKKLSHGFTVGRS